VLTAAHDLGAGTVVGTEDLVRTPFDPASVPDGVLPAGQVLGRTTVGPVRAGEPLTDVRLLDSGLLERYPGLVAAPVRIGDAAAVDLLRVGQHVTLLAADPQGSGPAVPVAESVPLIAVPPRARAGAIGGAAGLGSGALVVVAVDARTARSLAGAAVSSFLSVVIVR
jgi:hypothetical protein